MAGRRSGLYRRRVGRSGGRRLHGLCRRGREHPFVKMLVAVSHFPHVVAHIGDLAVKRMSPCLSNRIDQRPHGTRRNDRVGRPLEGPNRNVLQARRPGRVAAAGQGNQGRPVLWLRRSDAPGAVTTHRPTGEDAMSAVNRELALDRSEDRQSPFPIRTCGRPLGQDPPLRIFRLRKHDKKGKRGRPLPHVRAQADRRLQHAVRPPLAGTVKVQDHGPFLAGVVSLRHKEDVFVLARRILEDPRDKAVGGPVLHALRALSPQHRRFGCDKPRDKRKGKQHSAPQVRLGAKPRAKLRANKSQATHESVLSTNRRLESILGASGSSAESKSTIRLAAARPVRVTLPTL